MRKIVNRKALAGVVIFVISTVTAFADPDPQQSQKPLPPGTRSLDVSGAGTEPCADWTEARGGTSEEANRDSQRRIEWVLGFLTAVNMFTERSGSLHGGIDDREGALSWIDNHCLTNPKDPLFAAVADLVFDLKSRNRQR